MDKIKTIIFTSIIIFFISCYSYEYKQMTYYKKYDDQARIRMDGFYICYDTITNIGTSVKPYGMIFYLDGTGVFFRGDLRISKEAEYGMKNKSWTGPFIIDRDSIRWQTFWNTGQSPFSGKMKVFEQVFYIANDTTIEQFVSWRNGNSIYHFVKFDKKPNIDKVWFKHNKQMNKN